MKIALLFLSLLVTSFADAQIIYGVVTDSATKEPLINVSITVKKGDIVKGGQVTDFDGRFVIAPLDSDIYTVSVTYVGYKAITTVARVDYGKTELNFIMARISTGNLRSVIIPPYKNQRFIADTHVAAHIIPARPDKP